MGFNSAFKGLRNTLVRGEEMSVWIVTCYKKKTMDEEVFHVTRYRNISKACDRV